MENLSTKRDKIIKSLFQNELSNIQEELDAIKEAGTNPENVCSQINWDAKELEGKTKEEVDIINSIRKFIQDLFNEYQIRSRAGKQEEHHGAGAAQHHAGRHVRKDRSAKGRQGIAATLLHTTRKFWLARRTGER